MKDTSLHRRYGTQDSNEFNPQLDFAMFLKEARNYQVNKTKVDQLSSLEDVKQSNGLKNKKSWKSSFLFSWLKAAKKGNKRSLMETIPSDKSYSIPTLRCGHSAPSSEKSYSIPALRRGHSGPIYGNGGTTGSNRLWRQHSGQQTSFFKRTEEQMPYICLDKLNTDLHGIESYGPVYLVT
ncbi:Transcription factor hamlet like [Heracleum sosnowskyi]|uniref:Transcription factor hamlet like n=1 Tax=Heracleum sosnowskyi TaxID=360622 RepID=A0AAD8H765_9APIA|nr:Transcription factor hamlet like [Heracleum sosnowskyi]